MVSNNCEQRILYLFYVIFIFYTFQLSKYVLVLFSCLICIFVTDYVLG